MPSQERRRWPRSAFEREVIVYVEGSRLACRAENISVGGILLRPPVRLSPGAVVRVNLTFSEGSGMSIDGVVIRERSEGGAYAWAVRFRRLAAGLRKRLAALIEAEPASSGEGGLDRSEGASRDELRRDDLRRRGHGTERGVGALGASVTGPAHPAVGRAEAPGEKARRAVSMTGPAHPALSALEAPGDRSRWADRPRVPIEISVSPPEGGAGAEQRPALAANRRWEVSLADAEPISGAAIPEGEPSKIPVAPRREASKRSSKLGGDELGGDGLGGDGASKEEDRDLEAVLRLEMERLYRGALAKLGDPLDREASSPEAPRRRASATDEEGHETF